MADNAADFAQWIRDGWSVVDNGLVSEETYRELLDKMHADYRARVAVLDVERRSPHISKCPKCGQEVKRG